ncbi:MAG: L-serine ammonia-lyase [Rhodospirillales bacterium]|nr:L-serine ammonia-lyase [Rhodospirillales bacterium]MDE0380011.1 L-serine ammonia-lyase [Rhodospirillales bacterium]
MFLSVFDIFKVGIGPSSSHTMGPMAAAEAFLALLAERVATAPPPDSWLRIHVSLHGSLAFTGRGHATDRAIVFGLLGHRAGDIDIDKAEAEVAMLRGSRHLPALGGVTIVFDPHHHIFFDYGAPLPGHPNGMEFHAIDAEGVGYLSQIYYSIGGGFIVTAEELEGGGGGGGDDRGAQVPFPFESAASMLRMADESGNSIAQMMLANERTARSDAEVDAGLATLWGAMNACIDRGLACHGELPGGLRVKRRAGKLFEQLCDEEGSNSAQPHVFSDWLTVYAMAVNEENAGGGKVVTAPTNGAAGVIPAVLRYYLDHCFGAERERIGEFLLTAAAIGGLIKANASISGADAGCQAEVGSAAAMAAAGLCAVLDGTPAQVENAAEIALEHHLGMTCDPVGGLVQVPCIERNGIGATKAVAAASLALRGDGTHFMPLDNCIEAMRETGREMSVKFKETSLGGLAVNMPEC